MKRIAVFCGSSLGSNPIYKEKAYELGREMAKRNIGLVYGGGNKGLMGIIAHAVYENGGEVIGVLPKAMNVSQVVDNAVHTRLIIVEDMHERKSTMYSLSEGFVAMPGGIGTLEELFEIYTWRQLAIHNHNIALYNINGFWDLLEKQLKKTKDEGFLSQEVLDTLIVEEDPKTLLDKLEMETKDLPNKL